MSQNEVSAGEGPFVTDIAGGKGSPKKISSITREVGAKKQTRTRRRTGDDDDDDDDDDDNAVDSDDSSEDDEEKPRPKKSSLDDLDAMIRLETLRIRVEEINIHRYVAIKEEYQKDMELYSRLCALPAQMSRDEQIAYRNYWEGYRIACGVCPEEELDYPSPDNVSFSLPPELLQLFSHEDLLYRREQLHQLKRSILKPYEPYYLAFPSSTSKSEAGAKKNKTSLPLFYSNDDFSATASTSAVTLVDGN